MSEQAVVKGNTLPLKAVLSDGETNLYVRATIYAPDLTILTTKNLPHVSNGIYAESTYLPLVTGLFTVLYVVYDDAGYTTENTDYPRVSDTFFVVNGSVKGVAGLDMEIESVNFDMEIEKTGDVI